MIKYNTKTINDWYFANDNLIKVYHNGAVCYYKLEGSPTPIGQTPCYAVVDDITQYQSTEFVDVYDKATKKWYKLNNLNQYEKYGLYGEGRDITYYEGKLTVDGGYEYEYSTNGGWVNRGEVSSVEYPLHYPEKQDPPTNLSFDTMEEALAYQCPYVGVVATIGGVKYKFTYDEQSGTYQWSEINQYFQVNLNSQWQTSTSHGNISDTANYDFYQSFSNYHVNNGKAIMFITINGYTSFTFKVKNYSESGWDFVVVNNLDDTTIPKWRPIGVGSGIASGGYVYYSNKDKSSSTTWHDVTFDNLDGGEHYITITYGKDGSGNSNDDRGYVAIPKTQ